MAKSIEDKDTSIIKKVFSPWYHNKFFEYAISTLLVLLIIFLLYQVAFLVTPLLNFIYILSAPILISFLFYYLLRPIVYFFEDYSIPRPVTIIILYILGIILVTLMLAYAGPILAAQITAIANTSVVALERVKERSEVI